MPPPMIAKSGELKAGDHVVGDRARRRVHSREEHARARVARLSFQRGIGAAGAARRQRLASGPEDSTTARAAAISSAQVW